MKLFSDIQHWFENNNSHAYSLIRIFLGIALFIRGWVLISDPAAIIELAGTDKIYWWYSYISVVHLIGGLLLTLGFITRLAALLQIPILAGAVFFVHFSKGLMTEGQSLELSVFVLILLIIYFLFGSGVLAVDRYIVKKKSGEVLNH